MVEAGLKAEIDGVGNVFGLSRNSRKAILIGSHSDTQPTGGWLDGAMGVIYALEIARAFGENEAACHLPIDVVSWQDEEATYLGYLGSRSFCGTLPPDAVAAAENANGLKLTDSIRAAGLEGVAPRRFDRDRFFAYLEAHIEQGGHLEAEGKKIGVVTAIVGLRNFRIIVQGSQNHAGTTPMPLRRDAGLALIELAYAVNAHFRECAGERTVWTFGSVRFDPGSASIVPGRAEMDLQFRDPEERLLDRLEAKMRALVAAANERGPVEISVVTGTDRAAAAAMHDGLQRHLAAAAQMHAPGKWMAMPSGAGHDAQILAQRLPVAMLFVPSIGGISHDFAEDTAEEDIVLGCQVMATAVASMFREGALIAIPAARWGHGVRAGKENDDG